MATMNDQFRAALERLAASPDRQRAYLEELGTAPSADELAIEFCDALLVARPELPADVAQAAKQLDGYLSALSGANNVRLWTVLALAEAAEWQRVRDLATYLLTRMDDA